VVALATAWRFKSSPGQTKPARNERVLFYAVTSSGVSSTASTVVTPDFFTSLRISLKLSANIAECLIADVVELASASLRVTDNFDAVNHNRKKWEYSFDAYTGCYTANSKGRADFCSMLAGEHHTFKCLKTCLAISFLDLVPYADNISRREFKAFAGLNVDWCKFDRRFHSFK
jgi:hypothetical protein